MITLNLRDGCLVFCLISGSLLAGRERVLRDQLDPLLLLRGARADDGKLKRRRYGPGSVLSNLGSDLIRIIRVG